MQAPSHPADEQARRHELISLGILDTPPEERFDRLTRLAADVFDVPIALVSLVDDNRQWFKSKTGLEVSETSRDISFCGHAILGEATLVVPDAARDSRFADNPLVTGAPHIAFYAGQPLRGPHGFKVGTLCVMDRQPRPFFARDERLLRQLAILVEHELVSLEIADALARLRQTEARYEASFAEAPIGMAMIGLSGEHYGRVLEVNQALVALTGYSTDEAIDRSIQDFVHPDDLGLILAGAAAASRNEIDQLDREIRLVRADGDTIWVRVRSRRVNDESGAVYGIVHVNDITARRRYEDELARLALHDPLTGLANRRLIMERLAFALGGLRRDGGPVAVLYCDLDHFKRVNDTWGHEAGDALIVGAADRIAATVRSIDTAGRIGGDEFVLVCPDLADAGAVDALADRLRQAFARPISLGATEVTLSLSGGIAITQDPEADPAKLLSAADQALYRAKQSGRNRFETAPP